MMADTFRVLITGSRDWPFPFVVEAALESVAHFAGGARNMIVIHGACPSGADRFAGRWAARQGAAVAAHPARWSEHGRAAGPLRNAKMVGLGADVCLAFIGPCTRAQCRTPGAHGSHGVLDCAHRAEEVGIRTIRHDISKTH